MKVRARAHHNERLHLNRLLARYEAATLYGTVTEMRRAAAAYHSARRKAGLLGTKRRARHLAMW